MNEIPWSPWKSGSMCHQVTEGHCTGQGLSFPWASNHSLEATVWRGGQTSFLPCSLPRPVPCPGQSLGKDFLQNQILGGWLQDGLCMQRRAPGRPGGALLALEFENLALEYKRVCNWTLSTVSSTPLTAVILRNRLREIKGGGGRELAKH